MIARRPAHLHLACTALVLVLGLQGRAVLAADWERIPAADLAQSAPTVEPDADAEVQLWRVAVDDRYEGGNFTAYQDEFIRLKLFNDRAVQKYATVSINYAKGMVIDDVQARATQPDGAALQVAGKAFYDHVVIDHDHRKLRQRSFAIPGLRPGAIIEYRVQMHFIDRFSHYLPIVLQRDEPVNRLELQIHPLDLPDLTMGYRSFSSPTLRFQKQGGEYYVATLSHLPSYRRETFMPSDDLCRAWMLLYYHPSPAPSPETFWHDYAHETHADFLRVTKPDRRIREAANAAVAGAAADEDRIHRLFVWTRSHVRNVLADTLLTAELRRQAKGGRAPGEVLESGVGTWYEIDRVFASLARALGYDVRWASINTRDDVPIEFKSTLTYLLRSWDVAIRVGDGWQFFDPGNPWIAYGMLPANEEGVTALINGPAEGLVATTPLTGEDLSTRRATADLTLSDDGTLTGTVRIALSGHMAASRREREQDDTPAERIGNWTSELRAGLGDVEIVDPRVQANLDSDSDYVFVCGVRAAGYSQMAGKRLILQPEIFRRQSPAMFTDSRREHPVFLPYPWTEADSIRIRLPAGYELDSSSDAAPLEIEGVARYDLTSNLDSGEHALVVTRALRFGTGGNLIVPTAGYTVLKHVFDVIRERDGQTLVLAKKDS